MPNAQAMSRVKGRGNRLRAPTDPPAGEAVVARRVEVAGGEPRVQPDVVVCDIGLPSGMDGLAVARVLRGRGASAYLIAVGGRDVDDEGAPRWGGRLRLAPHQAP